jgi:hypothetical protein
VISFCMSMLTGQELRPAAAASVLLGSALACRTLDGLNPIPDAISRQIPKVLQRSVLEDRVEADSETLPQSSEPITNSLEQAATPTSLGLRIRIIVVTEDPQSLKWFKKPASSEKSRAASIPPGTDDILVPHNHR